MAEPVRIAVILDGADFTILTAGVPVEFVFVDYDDELDDPIMINGDPARVGRGMAEPSGEFVNRLFDVAASSL